MKLNIIKNTFYHSLLKSKLNKVMNKKDINNFINNIFNSIINIKKVCNNSTIDINSVIKNFNIVNHPMSILYNNYIDIFKKRQQKPFDKTNIRYYNI